MPHALLLSPDDQAVSAITGVLEEMSVTCERPLDGVSAAQKLNSQTFDLVLVDCENLPAGRRIRAAERHDPQLAGAVRASGAGRPLPVGSEYAVDAVLQLAERVYGDGGAGGADERAVVYGYGDDV